MYQLDNKKFNIIIEEVTSSMKSIYGDKLKEILLYGSYARGDYDKESDIDLMVLVDEEEKELKEYEEELNNIISDIGYKYMIVLSLVDLSFNKFNYWVDVVPYYKNVRNQGVILYEQ